MAVERIGKEREEHRPRIVVEVQFAGMLVIVQSYGEHDWWVEDRRSVANLGQRDARALGQAATFLYFREFRPDSMS